MADHYDDLETRRPETREASLFDGLRAQVAEAQAKAPGFARHLDGVDPEGIADRAALARLPVLRKAALVEMQRADPPFGGLTTRAPGDFTHIFQSPGPIYEPGMDTPDWWRFARALWAGGLQARRRRHQLLRLSSDAGRHDVRLGRAGGRCDGHLRAASATPRRRSLPRPDLGATAYAGTPDFLKALIEKADELGRQLKIAKAVVGGGPLFPAIRQFYAERGISCLQGYGTADLGSIAYESDAREGMIVDEGAIVEIVRPGTGDPVSEGEVGEVLVTVLNADYPLIRFATGDLSAVLTGRSPCGRTNMRIKGWMGRADQTTKVRGMFVRPEQVDAVVKRHPEVQKARLTVTRAEDQDAMMLAVETETPSPELAAAIAATLRDVVKLRGEVSAEQPGALPNDGKVIDDQRRFD